MGVRFPSFAPLRNLLGIIRVFYCLNYDILLIVVITMNNDLYLVINKKIDYSKQDNKVLEDKNIFITQIGTIYDFNNKILNLKDIKNLYNKYKNK